MSRIAFYARVSTPEQNADTQLAELRAHRAWDQPPREYVDHMSGSRLERPALQSLLEACDQGDVDAIYTTRVSRFGRSLKHQLELVKRLDDIGVEVHFIRDGLTTADDSPMGRFVVKLFGAIAEWELESLREQTREGLARARAAGVKLGRPSRTINWQAVDAMRTDGMTWAAVADALGIGLATLNRKRRARGEHDARG